MKSSKITPPSSPESASSLSVHLALQASPRSDYSSSLSPPTSPSSHDDDVSELTSQDRPLVPTSSADWEAKKGIIMELYMTQNLILNDVIQIMLSEHKFKATARMYKGQFAKWSWTKYNKSGSGGKSAKSRTTGRKRGTPLISADSHITKRAASRRASTANHHNPRASNSFEFLLFNEDDLEMEIALKAYSNYISQWSEHEAPWREDERFEDLSVLQMMRTALDHLTCSQIHEGGDMLRRAFLQVEDAISSQDNIEAIWDCCLAVPQLMHSSGHTSILYIFTQYLYQLTSIKMPGHPLAAVARRIFRLASRGDQQQLQRYIEGGWRLWVQLVGRQRGEQDHVTMHLKRGYVILQSPDPAIIGTFLSDFARSLEASVGTRGATWTTSRILELERLLVRMFVPLFTAKTTLRAETMLTNLLERIETSPANHGVPVHQRSYLDRYLFFSVHHFLAALADRNGDQIRAAFHRKRSLESPRDVFWLQTATALEHHLRAEGKIEEADEIQSEIQSASLA
ncbi:Clr5 domain-containing protein [Immersiella caudata]|uniref:Clr5 domain-containing protein n=1 Tax=Immersiella caudata TaxID=314043 RepID=A0AA39XH15_9PEZI|nr:Clr5 domain-containing protein [Immersiella caudata]